MKWSIQDHAEDQGQGEHRRQVSQLQGYHGNHLHPPPTLHHRQSFPRTLGHTVRTPQVLPDSPYSRVLPSPLVFPLAGPYFKSAWGWELGGMGVGGDALEECPGSRPGAQPATSRSTWNFLRETQLNNPDTALSVSPMVAVLFFFLRFFFDVDQF